MNSLIKPETPDFTQLKDEDIQQLAARMKQAITQASATSPGILNFAREKAETAATEIRFLLMQHERNLNAGLPDTGSQYYHLVNRKLNRYLAVLIALYRCEPGYILWMADSHPQVLLWVLTSADLESLDEEACAFALLLVDKLPAKQWLQIVTLASSTRVPLVLQSAAISELSQAELAMQALIRRGELTEAFASLCIREGTENVSVLARYQLARMGQEAGINWINEHGDPSKSLFTHLLVRKDKVAWLRRELLPQADALTDVSVYAILNRLPESFELPAFQQDQQAYLKAALAGDPEAVQPIIDAIQIETNDTRLENWVHALTLMLGELLPVRVADLDVKYDGQQAAEILKIWWQNNHGGLTLSPMMRMGSALSYTSSIDALRSQSLPAEFRTWVWKELCLNGGIYVAYDPMSWPERQRRAIYTLSNNTTAAERYNQRIRDAAVGR
ncbi:hypothetical protein [Photobacterium galatheae]|uniref:Uncharacterized protein n=1 Tax=Photobacterium galatheae TaxID=1654360 RepID=A0A066RTT2_9GAMM|nr:hypothetical protein [Photobacterium galatheae]KDM91097.1 hypothetical protein EA58_13165 [Photobacterium galatheae]MCM0150183.1 hypothetical protein [Photobacterium galatheae]